MRRHMEAFLDEAPVRVFYYIQDLPRSDMPELEIEIDFVLDAKGVYVELTPFQAEVLAAAIATHEVGE